MVNWSAFFNKKNLLKSALALGKRIPVIGGVCDLTSDFYDIITSTQDEKKLNDHLNNLEWKINGMDLDIRSYFQEQLKELRSFVQKEFNDLNNKYSELDKRVAEMFEEMYVGNEEAIKECEDFSKDKLCIFSSELMGGEIDNILHESLINAQKLTNNFNPEKQYLYRAQKDNGLYMLSKEATSFAMRMINRSNKRKHLNNFRYGDNSLIVPEKKLIVPEYLEHNKVIPSTKIKNNEPIVISSKNEEEKKKFNDKFYTNKKRYFIVQGKNYMCAFNNLQNFSKINNNKEELSNHPQIELDGVKYVRPLNAYEIINLKVEQYNNTSLKMEERIRLWKSSVDTSSIIACNKKNNIWHYKLLHNCKKGIMYDFNNALSQLKALEKRNVNKFYKDNYPGFKRISEDDFSYDPITTLPEIDFYSNIDMFFPLNYNSLEGDEFTLNNNQKLSLTKNQIPDHVGWRKLIKDDINLLKEYLKISMKIYGDQKALSFRFPRSQEVEFHNEYCAIHISFNKLDIYPSIYPEKLFVQNKTANFPFLM